MSTSFEAVTTPWRAPVEDRPDGVGRNGAAPNGLPVVVVGAGPTGLIAACLLGSEGVPTILVERHATTSDEAKAISLDDETLRVLQRAGVDADVYQIILPGTGTKYFGADGKELAYAHSPIHGRFGHPIKSPFQQPELERVLCGVLARFPSVSVRFETALVALRESADAVEVALEARDGARSTVAAAFVLGADGGRSSVREQLGVRMVGTSRDRPWLVLDTINDPHDQLYGMHYGDPRRPHVIIPGRGGHCRYEFMMLPGEYEPGEDVPFDFQQELLRPYRPLAPGDVARSTVYKFHSLVADRWQVGRVFMLGDAAHMMPPFAGQGMNSGARDADNLAWKIVEVAKGRAGPELLSTYEPERRPHAEAMVRLSRMLGEVVMTTSRRRAAVRDLLVRTLSRVEVGRGYFEQMRFRPRPHYQTGLVWPSPPAKRPPPVGRMLPQPRVLTASQEHVLLDTLLGPGYALVGLDTGSWVLERLRDPFWDAIGARRLVLTMDDRAPRGDTPYPVVADVGGMIRREFAAYRGQILLVRPDRYLAAIFPIAQQQAAARGLRQLMGKPLASAELRSNQAEPAGAGTSALKP